MRGEASPAAREYAQTCRKYFEGVHSQFVNAQEGNRDRAAARAKAYGELWDSFLWYHNGDLADTTFVVHFLRDSEGSLTDENLIQAMTQSSLKLTCSTLPGKS